MPDWTHLIRFVAVEDNCIHLGQLVDTSRDVGLDSHDGHPIKAYLIDGTIYDGRVSKHVMTAKQVSLSVPSALSAELNSRSCFRL